MDYLYHYTTIDVLALILKNRTIRFTPLDKMDDLQEQQARGIQRAGQFMLISSWTEEEEESIPLWKMYSSLENGVRIALPYAPFVKYEITNEEVCDLIGKNAERLVNGKNVYKLSDVSIQEMFDKNIFLPYGLSDPNEENENDLPIKVEYTADKNKLKPDVLEGDINSPEIVFEEIGKYKNDGWKFQSEWRYRLPVLPGVDWKKLDTSLLEMTKGVVNGTTPRTIEFLDRKLTDEAFVKMKVVTSPDFSESSSIILECLKEKYNPSMEIVKSSYAGLLK